MVHDAIHRFASDKALADRRMPVLMLSDLIFGVVQMDKQQPFKPDHSVERAQHAVKVVYEIVPRLKHVTGIEANAHASVQPDRVDEQSVGFLFAEAANVPPISLPCPDIVSIRTVVSVSSERIRFSSAAVFSIPAASP